MGRYRLALVDMDGTLADSMPCWLDLPASTFRDAGLPQPEGFQDRIRYSPMWEVAQIFSREYPELAAGEPLLERWYARMEQNYRHRVRLKASALPVLRLLREEGLQIFLMSATHHPLLDTAVEVLGLSPYIDKYYDESTSGSKHSEDAWRFCKEQTGLDYSEMILLEDAPRNLAAAAALGITCAAVKDGSMERWETELRSAYPLFLDMEDPAAPSQVRALLNA